MQPQERQSVSERTKFLLSSLIIGIISLSLTSCPTDTSSPNTAAANTAPPNTSSANTSPANTSSQQVAALTFSPAAGTYTSIQAVTISTTTSGASIRYTTDGSTPTETVGTAYSAPIRVATTETIKAIAYEAGWTDSTVATAAYTISGAVATPIFNPQAGTYSFDQSVTISCATSGAVIHYTTDGSTPTSSSATYSAAIPVAGSGTNETIKAIATETGMTDSLVASAAYAINYSQVSTPNFSPVAGTYSTDQSVTISCATFGAVIYYTIDNSTPSASSPKYVAPISVAGIRTTTTIKAYAIKAGVTASNVGVAAYSISYPQVSTPAFRPLGGTYSSDQAVTINSATSGAAIHYTTDGSIPTTSSATYSTPISVAGNGTSETIKAIATKTGMTDSSVGMATYTIYDTWQTIGTEGSGANQFYYPTGVAVDASGHIYVADYANCRIVRMNDMRGSGWTALGSFGNGTNQFINPAGVGVDASGHIYIADVGNSRIVRMDDMNGTNWTTIGSSGRGASQFKSPNGVAVDASGHIYIADYGNYRIVRMDDMSGTNWTLLGGIGHSDHGSGTNQFSYPAGVALDASGHIYIADSGNYRIVRVDDMSGTNWTTLGSSGRGTNQFDHPWGVAVDGGGNIYGADIRNNRIVRFIVP